MNNQSILQTDDPDPAKEEASAPEEQDPFPKRAGPPPGPYGLQLLSSDFHGYQGWEVFAIRSGGSSAGGNCLAVVGAVDRAVGQCSASLAKRMQRSPEMFSILTRLTEKVSRINGIQHSGGEIQAEDWAELYQIQNEARAILDEVGMDPSLIEPSR